MGICEKINSPCGKPKNAGIIVEQNTIKNKVEPIEIRKEEIINRQMKKSICKINVNKYGTGFFCRIPFPDESKCIYVLITNKSLINKEQLLNKKRIDISLDNDREDRTINIISERKIYSCKKYDITFIEILPKVDGIYEVLDTDIRKLNAQYEKKIEFLDVNISQPKINDNIYILQYIDERNCIKSNAKIMKVSDVEIEYNSSEKLKIGGPILSNDLKLIGINIEKSKGILLRECILEFYNDALNKEGNNKNTINYIDCYYTLENNEEFNLLNDYQSNTNEFIQEFQYNIEKENKKFLEDNIDIIIDSHKIRFNFKFKSNINKIHVRFIFKQILNDLSFMFFNCKNLESIDFSFYDTNNITNMICMFSGCLNLKYVNLSLLKTKNDINMENIFSGCKNLKIVEFPINHNINVTNLAQSFFFLFIYRFSEFIFI